MALGTGLSSTKVDFIESDYVMGNSLLFDGVDDYGKFSLEALTPTNGTMKPVENGLTLAGWVKLTDDESDGAGIYNTTAIQKIFGCTINGGFSIYFDTKRMYFHIKLQDGNGTNTTLRPYSHHSYMRLWSSGNGQVDKPLYKSDGWHFVVGTWDGNKVAQMYVDGGRSLGYTLGSAFGSMPETATSKLTAANPVGNNPSGQNKWYIKYKDNAVDHTLAATSTWNTLNNPKTTPASEWWGGYIGDFCQWNRELTSAEIDTLYNYHNPIDMSTMHPSDITGYYQAKNASGTSLPATVGSYDITLGQAMTPTTVVPTLDVTTLGGGYA